jgi:hypothetical protein
VIRWLVGIHVRRQLTELGTVYLQLEQTVSDDDHDCLGPWLRKAREGCEATAEALPRFHWPGIIVLGTFAATLAGALSKLPGAAAGPVLGNVAMIIGIALLIFIPVTRASYLFKRSLFLPDAGRVDKLRRDCQKKVLDGNVYVLEDELFGLLQRGKKEETQIDHVGVIMAAYL